jgi:hypothetical protein
VTTRRVSYQAMLTDADAGGGVFAPLSDEAIATRRRDASKKVTVTLSKAQLAWLRSVESSGGKGVDVDAVMRALVDLGRELDVNWPAVEDGSALREAVREAVRVRRRSPGT